MTIYVTWNEEMDRGSKRQNFAKNMFLLKGVEFHTKMNICVKNEIFYFSGPFLHFTSHMKQHDEICATYEE